MNARLVLQLFSVLLDHLQEISAAITEAEAKNENALSADRWATIIASDDRARAALTSVLAGLKPDPSPSPGVTPPTAPAQPA